MVAHPFQYPYDLEIGTISGGGHDGDGNPISSTENWSKISKCRDEANTKGISVALADGQYSAYEYLVLLPLTCPVLEVGSPVRITNGSFLRGQGTVKRFRVDLFHCRLWV